MERNEVRLEDCLKNCLGEVRDFVQAGLYHAEQTSIPLRTRPCVLAEITDPVRLSVAEWGTGQPGTTFLLAHPFGFSGATWVAYVGLHVGLAVSSALTNNQTILLCPQWPEQSIRDPRVLLLTPTGGEVRESPAPTQWWGRGTLTFLERLGVSSRVEALVEQICEADPILKAFRPREVIADSFLRTLLTEALDAFSDCLSDDVRSESNPVG